MGHAGPGGGASAAPTETVLHSFCSLPGCSDGANPQAGLIADSSGNLYGTTKSGGVSGCIFGDPITCGVVFKLSPGGTETVLHSFTGLGLLLAPIDGFFPLTGLIADSSGNLYGTTNFGGDPECAPFGCGVVFKLSPGGGETVLHWFTGGDGEFPAAGLIADSSGNLYGTTEFGGVASNAGGAVFKLSPGGTETRLHSFCSLPGCSDGANPVAGLIADRKGNLYGTTELGGGAAWCSSSRRAGPRRCCTPSAVCWLQRRG